MNFLNVEITFEITPPGTIWWHGVAHGRKQPRQRADILFSIERVFMRETRKYVYVVFIGRLRIEVST